VSGLRLDTTALLHALDEVEGRRFLGAVVGGMAVELVFEGEHGRNLVSIYVEGHRAGEAVLGGVAMPESYARSCRRWRPWGVRR
jgi:hypothetical protein